MKAIINTEACKVMPIDWLGSNKPPKPLFEGTHTDCCAWMKKQLIWNPNFELDHVDLMYTETERLASFSLF